MGLFDLLFGSKAKKTGASAKTSTPTQKQAAQDSFSAWQGIPECEREYRFDGEKERKVIVYNGAPVSSLSAGTEIALTPYLGEGVMYSRFSDWSVNTKDCFDTIMCYKGTPIGFCSIPRGEVKTLARKGIRVSFSAKCLGDLEGYSGIKEIVLYAPAKIYADDVLGEISCYEHGATEKPQVLQYNEYDEEDYIELASKKRWQFPSAKIEFIPTPKGSSAKPHILLTSKRGKKISEVTARNSYYAELAELVRDDLAYLIQATRIDRDEEDRPAFYHICVFYWEK